MTEQAIVKLGKELKEAKLSRRGQAVGEYVADTLRQFCRSNPEFAQAVVQSDKTVGECIEHTVKDAGSSIPDIEVYRRAADFYFPGATVHFQMTIDLGDGGFSNSEPEAPKSSLLISLDELLK